MDIRSAVVGAGAVVLLAGGIFGAAAWANDDVAPAPVVVEPTIQVEKETPPVVVVPEPVVTPEPAPVVVVPEPAPAPEVVVPEPVVEPEPINPPAPDDQPTPPRDLDFGPPPPPNDGGLPSDR